MKTQLPFIIRCSILLILLIPSTTQAQWSIPDLDDIMDDIPGLDDILVDIPGFGRGEYEPALSSNLDDSVTEVPFLDDYNPTDYQRLISIPEKPGRYYVITGRWALNVESFCLKAGTYGPSEGDGYLFAPLRGPRANVITKILQNYYLHPDIDQRDAQLLLWGIIARTKISDMDQSRQRVAQVLLTNDEISDLNGGALGLVPDELYNEAFDRLDLSPSLNRVVESETRLRSMFSGGGSSYSELERVAVFSGIPPEDEEIRHIPGERWCYHPDGYFIRYKPYNYKLTRIEMSVPDLVTLERDHLWRIIAITDTHGNRLDIDYDENIGPVTGADQAEPIGYAFKEFKFTLNGSTPQGETNAINWQNSGWTLTTVPTTIAWEAGGDGGRYTDVADRIDSAITHREQVRSLISQVPETEVRNIFAWQAIEIALITQGIQDAVASGSQSERHDPTLMIKFLKQAWMSQIHLVMSADTIDDASTLIAKLTPLHKGYGQILLTSGGNS